VFVHEGGAAGQSIRRHILEHGSNHSAIWNASVDGLRSRRRIDDAVARTNRSDEAKAGADAQHVECLAAGRRSRRQPLDSHRKPPADGLWFVG
jgi:hypothetical protein